MGIPVERAGRTFCAIASALLLLVGCEGGEDGAPKASDPASGDGKFAERCEKTEDCESLLCVRVDASGGLCTETCTSDARCPTADNWACIQSDSIGEKICACRKLDEAERCADGMDNDCDGRVDDCRMCDGMAVPNNDPRHCGACNNACRADQQCLNQACSCPDATPDDCGACVATRTDPSHCGTCGNACGLGRSCVGGECVCPDASLPDHCDGVGCVDLATDPLNCGACGTACPMGQGCVGGECVCPEGAASTYCDGVGCVDLEADPLNCGECGTLCPTGQDCVDGECSCPEGVASTYCDGVGCVDSETDSNHCGACGNACTLATACSGGDCGCPNAASPDFCDGVGCVSFATDVRNCGGCGEACRADQVCADGECGCATGSVECGGVCTDTARNRAHCGGCDRPCATAQTCVGGTCGCELFGFTVCGDDCANLATDAAHCGSCDRACRSGETCSASNCMCGSGLVCDDVCVSPNDPANCGACGNRCPTGQFCSTGQCRCQGSGLNACGSNCVDFLTDEAHCGSCTTVCRNGETCTGGVCRCPTGMSYCEAAGTCVNLTSDTSHCGACNAACDPTEICQSGICRCATSGQLYCASTNACTDTLSNVAHCGACDRACNPTEVCRSGGCACPLTAQRYCASATACVDIQTSNAHCGACDRACPTGSHCASGTCVCDQVGYTLCSGVCYDLTRDAAHCGSCTNACTGNLSCVSSQCRCPDPTVGVAVRTTNNALGDASVSAAWDGTHVGVLYAQYDFTPDSIRFMLLNPDGSVVSDSLLYTLTAFNPPAPRPSLVWTGTEYAGAWVDATVKFVRLDAAGVPKGPPVDIANATTTPTSTSLAWSSTNTSYAFAGLGFNSAIYQRLGVDASSPSPQSPFTHTFTPAHPVVIGVAPDGVWGVAFGGSNPGLALFNPDGSRTLSPVTLGTGGVIPHALDMVHDGTTWLTVWTHSPSRTTISANRTAQPNSQVAIVTVPTPTAIWSPALQVSGSVATMAWAQAASDTQYSKIRLQRFSIPAGTSSALTPIHNAIDVLATANTTGDRPGLVRTGPTSLLVVWSDNRFGVNQSEIFAAPVSLGACP